MNQLRHPRAPGCPACAAPTTSASRCPNLDQAVAFFVDVIGCEPFYELGPFKADDDWMATHLDVHPRAVMKQLKFLRCRSGSNFELFEYDAP